jgi:hypothetical protein
MWRRCAPSGFSLAYQNDTTEPVSEATQMGMLEITSCSPSLLALRSRRRQAAIELSERILRADSATRELERWCAQHDLGDGRIVALCERDALPQRLDDNSMDTLAYPAAREHALFRSVQLATAGLVVAKALNWYFPENLTPEMREQLLTTNIPFGCVVAPFNPSRRTFFLSRCQSAEPDGTQVAFEHHAIVHAANGAPLAVVHERFLGTLFEA